MITRWCLLLTLFATVLLSGCVSSTIQLVRQAETGLAEGQAVAILSRATKKQDAEAGKDFVHCVALRTASGNQRISVVSEKTFVDSMFPWFEPRTAPTDLADLGRLVAQPAVAERINQIGVRYIVWIEGSTKRRDQSGTLQCAVASGGIPACFGFLTWEGAAEYEATIWDVSNQVHAGKLSSEATGVSIVPAVIVPLPFIARVQASACTSLAEQIQSFIKG